MVIIEQILFFSNKKINIKINKMLTAIVQGGVLNSKWDCFEIPGDRIQDQGRMRDNYYSFCHLWLSEWRQGLNPQIGESSNSEVIPVPTTSFPKSEFFRGQPEHTQPQITTDVYILEVVHSTKKYTSDNISSVILQLRLWALIT